MRWTSSCCDGSCDQGEWNGHRERDRELDLFVGGRGWRTLSDVPARPRPPRRRWPLIAEAISGTHTTDLLDLPGSGRSPAARGIRRLSDVVPVLEQHLDDLGIASSDVIGHSMGGMLGLALAITRPSRVRSLTLLDSGYFRVPRMPVRMCGPVGVVVPVFDVLHRIAGDRILGGKPANARPPGVDIDYEQDLAEISAAGVGLLLAAYRADPRKMLRQVTVPCLLAYGGRPGKPRARAKTLQAVRDVTSPTQVTATELQGDHDIYKEDPRCPDVVRDFLATVG